MNPVILTPLYTQEVHLGEESTITAIEVLALKTLKTARKLLVVMKSNLTCSRP